MRSFSEYINAFGDEFTIAMVKVFQEQMEQLRQATILLFEAWRDNRAVFIMGNGGSDSTAEHFSADLAKTVNDSPEERGIRAFSFDNRPLKSAVMNDRLKEDSFIAWLDTYYESGGIGIGISVHGGSGGDVGGNWSQNLLKAMQFIKDRDGETIGLTGFDGGPMNDLVDIPIVVPVRRGSEFFGTPVVESMHVVVHHCIVFRLKEMIEGYKRNQEGRNA